MNDDSTIQLLEMLEKKYPLAATIYVILDNAKYHYSRKVRRFLGSLWKFFKKKVLYNTYYEKIEDFRQACIKFFRNINSYWDQLVSIMNSQINT